MTCRPQIQLCQATRRTKLNIVDLAGAQTFSFGVWILWDMSEFDMSQIIQNPKCCSDVLDPWQVMLYMFRAVNLMH